MGLIVRHRAVRHFRRHAISDFSCFLAIRHFVILSPGKRPIPVEIDRETVIQQKLARIETSRVTPGLEHILIRGKRSQDPVANILGGGIIPLELAGIRHNIGKNIPRNAARLVPIPAHHRIALGLGPAVVFLKIPPKTPGPRKAEILAFERFIGCGQISEKRIIQRSVIAKLIRKTFLGLGIRDLRHLDPANKFKGFCTRDGTVTVKIVLDRMALRLG